MTLSCAHLITSLLTHLIIVNPCHICICLVKIYIITCSHGKWYLPLVT